MGDAEKTPAESNRNSSRHHVLRERNYVSIGHHFPPRWVGDSGEVPSQWRVLAAYRRRTDRLRPHSQKRRSAGWLRPVANRRAAGPDHLVAERDSLRAAHSAPVPIPSRCCHSPADPISTNQHQLPPARAQANKKPHHRLSLSSGGALRLQDIQNLAPLVVAQYLPNDR